MGTACFVQESILVRLSWKVQLHPAYSFDYADVGRNLVAYPGVFDARLGMDDWTQSAWQEKGFDDAYWKTAVEKGMPPVAPWHNLELNRFPSLTKHGLQNYSNFPASKFPYEKKTPLIKKWFLLPFII